MRGRWRISILLTLIAFINYGCMNWVVHRGATPIRETPVASGPNVTKVHELTVSAQPTVSNPQAPVTFRYFERWNGVQEMVVTYEQREYMKRWNPFAIPASLFFLALIPIIHAVYITIGPETPYYNEHVSQYGCPDLYLDILYGSIGYEPCGGGRGGPKYRELPEAEEIRQTDPTVELRYPLAYRLVQAKVTAQGVKWQKDSVLTVVTDAEGQRGIPLHSAFYQFPNAPLEVTVTLTADEAQTTVHLDSQACAAIFSHVKKGGE